MIKIIRCDSRNKEVIELIQLLDIELKSRYGALQIAYDVHNVITPDYKIVLAYINNKPGGCGCFKPYSEKTAFPYGNF